VDVATSIQESIDLKGYSIHGCVYSWTIHALNQEWDCDLARLAVKFVGAYVPEEQAIQPWPTQRRILQHVARCLQMVLDGLSIDYRMAWSCHELGRLFYSQGKLAEAEQMF
jgi:hypothetical protein